MPGPFPGMDPSLESAALWTGVHQGIIGSLRALLNTLLPPGYVADMGERVYVTQPDRSIYPDVGGLKPGRALSANGCRASTFLWRTACRT